MDFRFKLCLYTHELRICLSFEYSVILANFEFNLYLGISSSYSLNPFIWIKSN